MVFERLRQLQRARPFRPFTIRLRDRAIAVNARGNISIPREGGCQVCITTEQGFELVDVADVERIVLRPTSKRAR